MKSKKAPEVVITPAVKSKQGNTTLYLTFLPGSDLLRIADIRRLQRDKNHKLEGFQRQEIRDHVNEIAQYLDHGGTLFPNAIILALEPSIKFDGSRGPTKSDVTVKDAALGRLHIPVHEEGQRLAWIVDGQQRSLALSKSSNPGLVVPVVAFVTDSIQVQREQFILVNRAKPLPQRLIDELLPETQGISLPRDLTMRQMPSRLCDALNSHEQSPLRGLIKRSSQTGSGHIVIDTAILDMIKRSLNNPIGALADFKALGDETGDANSMLQTLIDFWTAVRDTFPDAWGLPPSQSRLMHSAGIAALGDLMDRMAARATTRKGQREYFATELARIKKDCAWTTGMWKGLDREWDQIQNTPQDVKMLSQTLVQLYAQKIKR